MRHRLVTGKMAAENATTFLPVAKTSLLTGRVEATPGVRLAAGFFYPDQNHMPS